MWIFITLHKRHLNSLPPILNFILIILYIKHGIEGDIFNYRPVYQYEAAAGQLPAGFSAINLSVKCVTTAQAQMKGAGPHTSPGGTVIDLSTSSVTTTSPQVSSSSVKRMQKVTRESASRRKIILTCLKQG